MDDSDLPQPTKRLSFRTWQADDIPLAAAIWGDASVTALTGGPFTPEAVAQRLAQECANWGATASNIGRCSRLATGR